MGGKRLEQPVRRRWTASKLIALGLLAIDASATYIVLYLCWLSIRSQFTGSLPYLTALIGALQAATAVVLGPISANPKRRIQKAASPTTPP